MATVAFNLPLMSIPLCYLIAYYPHGHALYMANRDGMLQYDNRNPRSLSYIEGLRKRLSTNEFAAYERGESCHRNHLDNMPLYIATVFAGMMAEIKAGEGEIGLEAFCIGWLINRVLYTINYLNVETTRWSYLRLVLYMFGTLWSFWLLFRSALILGN